VQEIQSSRIELRGGSAEAFVRVPQTALAPKYSTEIRAHYVEYRNRGRLEKDRRSQICQSNDKEGDGGRQAKSAARSVFLKD
jgi:hypothetical protein